jgi:hypothetical protein
MINRRHTAPPPAMGGSHKIPNIGKIGSALSRPAALESDMRAYHFEEIVW